MDDSSWDGFQIVKMRLHVLKVFPIPPKDVTLLELHL